MSVIIIFMQDKYVGDIGDFGKYILLNQLHRMCNNSSSIGVNWYFVTRAEDNNKDGRHLDYLSKGRNNPSYLACSQVVSPLFMRNMGTFALNRHMRKVAEVERENNGILPAGDILFYRDPVPYEADTPDARREEREKWFESSLKHLGGADILFLDPDNGIEPLNVNNGGRELTVRSTQAKAVKYAFYSEVERYYSAGKSLIIYNHKDRKSEADYRKKIQQLKDYGCIKCVPSAIRFHRVSVRDYIFLPQEKHKELFRLLMGKLTLPPLDFIFREYSV